MASVTGTAGNDFIHVPNDPLAPLAGYFDVPGATDGDDVITPGGGDDVIKAGGGDDTLLFFGNFTAQDHVDGGSGNDALQLNGDYSSGVVFAASTLVNVETVALAAGHSYSLTTANATVAAGARLKIDGSALLAGDVLTADASAETDGQVALIGGAGNDVLTGGAGTDFLYLYQGGNDTAYGGGGDDVFVFFGTFTAADRIDGGPGNDIAYLHGNYAAGVTFTNTTMVNVETINLDDGFDLNDSFRLVTNDATVVPGQTLTVTGLFLSPAGHIDFDGSAETDGKFVILGGAASDTFTGGTGDDTFTGAAGNDTINGGGGTDTAVYTGNRADYSVAFNATSLTFTIADQRAGSSEGVDTATSVEQLKFADGLFAYDTAGFVTSQTVTNMDGTSSQTLFDNAGAKPWATQVLIFDAHGNLASQTVNLDNGSRWTNTVDVAGTSNWLWKTDHYDPAGQLLSQTGRDDDGSHWLTLIDASNRYGWSSATFSFDAQWNQTGLSGTNDDGTHNLAAGQVMAAFDTELWFTTPYDPAFDPAPAVFSGNALNYLVTFDAAAQAYEVSDRRPGAPDGTHIVANAAVLQFADGASPAASLVTRYAGGSGDDAIAGNDKSGAFDLSQGGNDTATGGDGDDGFTFGSDFDGGDRVDGGGGTNQMRIGGLYDGTVVLDPAKVTNIQVMAFVPGDDYAVRTLTGFAGAGHTFTFWSVGMDWANHVYVDGGAETTGAFKFFLGQGNDIARGGTGDDLFYGEGGADTLTGGLGADTFAYLAPFDSNGAGGTAYDSFDFTAGVDKIKLAGIAVTAVDGTASGTLSVATFDTDLAAVLGDGHANELDQGHAVLFTATGGDLSDHTFLIVGTSGAATGYAAGTDYVFDVTAGKTVGLATSDFI